MNEAFLNVASQCRATATSDLTQPEQEPVAWTVAGQVRDWGKDFSAYQTQHYVRPIYASPKREWVGLTDEEVRECYAHVEGVTVSEAVILMGVVRATQAKLKEKNA